MGAGYSQALLKNLHAYVVASKAVPVGHRNVVLHLGARYDRFKFEAVERETGIFADNLELEDTSQKVSFFGGVEVPLDRKGRWSAIGEAGTRNSSFDIDFTSANVADPFKARFSGGFPYSLSLRYADNGWRITGGVMRQGLVDDSGLFAQIGKTF